MTQRGFSIKRTYYEMMKKSPIRNSNDFFKNITRENQRLIRKITGIRSMYKKSKFQKSYCDHLIRVRMISRYSKLKNK